jgi:hypothetical protein
VGRGNTGRISPQDSRASPRECGVVPLKRNEKKRYLLIYGGESGGGCCGDGGEDGGAL